MCAGTLSKEMTSQAILSTRFFCWRFWNKKSIVLFKQNQWLFLEVICNFGNWSLVNVSILSFNSIRRLSSILNSGSFKKLISVGWRRVFFWSCFFYVKDVWNDVRNFEDFKDQNDFWIKIRNQLIENIYLKTIKFII